MIKLTFHSFLFMVCLSFVGQLFAQEQVELNTDKTVEEFSLTGSLDSYFHNSFRTLEEAPRTSFSNLPGFSLGMINLIGTYKGKKSGFVTDLVYGPRGSDAVFNAPLYRNTNGSSQIINQMFVYYQLSKNVKLSFGQFNTFLSYEVISPTLNFHYSTSYLFSYGPFSHTGLWTDISLGKGWNAKVAIMNPTDYTEFNPFDSYTIGGQLAFAKNNQSIYLNSTFGDPDGKLQKSDSIGSVSKGNSLQIDVTANFTLTKKYTLGVSSSYRAIKSGETKTTSSIETSSLSTAGFYGFILYQKFTFSSSFQIGLRTEYFGEFKNGVGAIGNYNSAGKASVIETTLSANFISGNFKFIPELRFDKTSLATYTNASSAGSPLSKMVSLNIAVVYALPALTYKRSSQK